MPTRTGFSLRSEIILLAGLAAVLPRGANAADAKPGYAKDVQPILKAKCYSCHGADKSESGLRLDRKADALSGGDSGKVINPGDAAGSVLIKLVSGDDPDKLMPPDGERLTADQIKTLKAWIDDGADWREDSKSEEDPRARHWSFQPVRRPEPPDAGPAAIIRSPIDAFVQARLLQEGLTAAPEADRATLIRRLSLDLLGLPPSPEAVDRFVGSTSPRAYEELVDELLASPHFGERWGRHWLDLARYADSDGYEKDNPRYHAWKYRDWVIAAVNNDLPFDQFTMEQLAGDLLPNPTESQRIATGFNRQTLTNTEGGVDQEQFRVEATFDRTETLGTVWLGLTVGCCRCHTHKYDPLTQREYYQLFAFFNAADETSLNVPSTPEAWAAYEKQLQDYRDEQSRRRRALEAAREPLKPAFDAWEAELRVKLAEIDGRPARFETVDYEKVVSENGATLTKQPDGSYLASGTRPARDVYLLEARLPAGATGLKLEALAHPSLPAMGPGWADHGNFVLSEITVDVIPEANAELQRLRFARARASYSQGGFEPTFAIDGPEDSQGWAVAPQFGKAHEAVFVFDEPSARGLADGSRAVRVRLSQQYENPSQPPHPMGCFRLTAMTGLDASSLGLSDDLLAVVRKPSTERSPEEQDRLFAHFAARDPAIQKLQAELAEFEKSAPFKPEMPAAVLHQRDAGKSAGRTTHILRRGDFLQPGDEVAPATFAVLNDFAARDAGRPADRLDLAKWLIDERNPLTSRVAANHVWMHLFGHGLVRTVNDFGTRGDRPTHPELLDWLAAEFLRLGWSRKSLIREIVLSHTYRQSSASREELSDRDPNNLWLARQNRLRVEAEVVRDAALSASGLLEPRVGGPSVFPPLPPGIEELSYADNFKWGVSDWNTRPDRPWGVAPKDDLHRRGMYTFFKRTAPHPNLTTFDCPDANLTCVARQTSNTPLQALVTLNNDTFLDAARGLAGRVLTESHPDDDSRLRRLLRFCLGREIVSDDLRDVQAFLRSSRDYYRAHPEEAKEFAGASERAEPAEERAAWTAAARLALNLDEFLTRE